MNNKRILAIVLALVLLMAGCDKKKETVENTTEMTEVVDEPTTTVASVPGVEASEFDDETEPTEEETLPEATENTEPAEIEKPTEPVVPEESKPTTEPSQPTAPPATEQMGYERFQNLSAAEQQAYMATFESLDHFFAWYNQAKAEYEAANPPIDVGDGNVDIGDLFD